MRGGYRLRGSEVDLLERAGRFRVTFTEDLNGPPATTFRFREDPHRSARTRRQLTGRARDGPT